MCFIAGLMGAIVLALYGGFQGCGVPLLRWELSGSDEWTGCVRLSQSSYLRMKNGFHDSEPAVRQGP